MLENLIHLKDDELKESCLNQLYENAKFDQMFNEFIAEDLKDKVVEDFLKSYVAELYDLYIDVDGGSASISFSEGIIKNVEEFVVNFGNDSEDIDLSNIDFVQFDDNGQVWEIYLKDVTIEYDDDFKYEVEVFMENALELFLESLEVEVSKNIDKLEDCDSDMLFDIIQTEGWNILVDTENGCIDEVSYW